MSIRSTNMLLTHNCEDTPYDILNIILFYLDGSSLFVLMNTCTFWQKFITTRCKDTYIVSSVINCRIPFTKKVLLLEQFIEDGNNNLIDMFVPKKYIFNFMLAGRLTQKAAETGNLSFLEQRRSVDAKNLINIAAKKG